jgi:CubicO group peptidase (beta-lactamase class C family)
MTSAQLQALLDRGVQERVAPGFAAAVGTVHETIVAFAGAHTYEDTATKVGQDTLYDLASLTKIVAATSVAMSLVQSNELDLDAHVQSVVAEFVGENKDDVTVRNLLRHDSGLAAYGNYERLTNALEVKDEILRSPLRRAPAAATEYSCLGFVALMEVEQRLTGESFEDLFRKRVAAPLGLKDTFFKPSFEDRKRCAPTETPLPWRRELEYLSGYKRVNEKYVQGSVHDPIAFLVGGVSGNAGLFSTVGDVARVARAWLTAEGPFKKETVAQFTKRQGASTYALGFDTRSEEGSSAGDKFSLDSFGHTGYTGTSVWVDPENGLFAVLLSNRVNPSASNEKIKKFRPRFHNAVFGLLKG